MKQTNLALLVAVGLVLTVLIAVHSRETVFERPLRSCGESKRFVVVIRFSGNHLKTVRPMLSDCCLSWPVYLQLWCIVIKRLDRSRRNLAWR